MKVEENSGKKFACCRQLRLFLKTNKIFLDTLGAVLFWALGFWIAFNQWKISNRQLELTKSQRLPLIYAKQSLEYNSEAKFFENDIINISNVRGPLTRFSFDTAVIFDVELQPKGVANA